MAKHEVSQELIFEKIERIFLSKKKIPLFVKMVE